MVRPVCPVYLTCPADTVRVRADAAFYTPGNGRLSTGAGASGRRHATALQ
nr:hypothetical protein RVX_3001 [Nitratidesulfovibrio sp. HK-II]